MSFHEQCLFSEVSASGGERVKLVANSLLIVWVFLALCTYQRIWKYKCLFPMSFELPLPFVGTCARPYGTDTATPSQGCMSGPVGWLGCCTSLGRPGEDCKPQMQGPGAFGRVDLAEVPGGSWQTLGSEILMDVASRSRAGEGWQRRGQATSLPGMIHLTLKRVFLL